MEKLLKAKKGDLRELVLPGGKSQMNFLKAGQIEQAYEILNNVVKPHIQRVCVDESSMVQFKQMMAAIEAHMYAMNM